MGIKKKIAIVLIVLVLIVAIFFFIGSTSQVIGSNNFGSVEKVSYSYYGDAQVTIAIISGMHSRETLHSSVLPVVAKVFALTHKVNVVNYKVHVTSNPLDFDIGRANGESLVHDYVVNDLKDNGADLVIIGHDHEPGYGEGYYVATPTMDKDSVSLASSVTSDIGFNYYKRDTNVQAKSTSILQVDNPIVATGSKVFVFEIPEDDNFINAFLQSFKLINSAFEKLSK